MSCSGESNVKIVGKSVVSWEHVFSTRRKRAVLVEGASRSMVPGVSCVLETHGIHVDKVGFEENTSAGVGGYTQMARAL